jgi:hypothetical protein
MILIKYSSVAVEGSLARIIPRLSDEIGSCPLVSLRAPCRHTLLVPFQSDVEEAPYSRTPLAKLFSHLS